MKIQSKRKNENEKTDKKNSKPIKDMKNIDTNVVPRQHTLQDNHKNCTRHWMHSIWWRSVAALQGLSGCEE